MRTIAIAVSEGRASDAALAWLTHRPDLATVDILAISISHDGASLIERARTAVDRVSDAVHRVEPACRVATEISVGKPFDRLVALSDRADVLVVGSDRPRPLAALLHTSLPMRLSGRVHCDLLVVPAEWRTNTPGGEVIVGWDDDEASAGALDCAAEQARTVGAPLHIVHAWTPIPTSPYDPEGGADLWRATEEAELRLLQGAADRARNDHPDLEIRQSLHAGSVLGALLETATPALVVVGTHRRSAVGEILFGSTGDALIRAADRCPVLVCKSPQKGNDR